MSVEDLETTVMLRVVDPAEGWTPPMRRGRRRWLSSRPIVWSTQFVLGMVALALLAAPFGVAWRMSLDPTLGPVIDQQASLAGLATAGDLERWSATAAGLAVTAPPIVLCYHDVRPGSPDPYVVSPQQFDLQLTALEAAGYRTITSAEYTDYLRGAPLPPRSVYLTFDDGTGGLWTYGDSVLARHHAHAASYLISGRVGTHRPYYLSWDEVGVMARSGRWDFQAHTHDLHSRAKVSPEGVVGSVLTNRVWDATAGRLETQAEYEKRISTDITGLFSDFNRHGLPRPTLFAYPFSEMTDPSNDNSAVEFTQRVINDQFVGSFTNKTRSPMPSSRRSAATKVTGRVEVIAKTSPDELLQRVMEWTALGTAGDHPLDHPSRWLDWNNDPLPSVAAFTGPPGMPAAGQNPYTYATYAPFATADWTNYAVALDVTGLRTAKPGFNIFVRMGSSTPLVVRVSRFRAELVRVAGDQVLDSKSLGTSATHHVEIAVTDLSTSVVIDGRVKLTMANQPGTGTTGGIALAVRQGDLVLDHPAVANMVVTDAVAKQ
jgi:biofilm PGA synthesis lipoprotein PgaB